MFKLIRQSSQQLRLWLIAAAAVLALTSVLEAGHVHGVFTHADDQCTLCQHSVALDKILTAAVQMLIPLLLGGLALSFAQTFVPQQHSLFALIRAPPAQLHTR